MREGDQQHEVREQLLGTSGLRVSHITGTVLQSEKVRLQRLIFRATRGTALTYFQDIEQPIIDYRGGKHAKSVYILIFQEGEYVREKLTKIIDSFLGNRFEINEENFGSDLRQTTTKMKEIRKALKMCYTQIESYLKTINSIEASTISKIQLYKLYLLKEKSIYETINTMRLGHKFFIGAFWLPKSELQTLEIEVALISSRKNIKKPQISQCKETSLTPPTFIRTNDFTYPFQEITNTYGVPWYKEVNPSYFGIVTFPFLFGVMFGDICHGTLLFLLAAVLWVFNECLSKSPLKQMLPYRFLLLLMGVFAMFWGWWYNDFASIPVEIFETWYDIKAGELNQPQDWVYPFGVDHTWYISSNHLSYLNSLKMKISVILGVAQMCLGISMKAANALYFKRMLDFTYEFIPQIILMLCLFGWMDLLIIIKWCTNWEDNESRAPGIVSIMINMFLNFGEIEKITTDSLFGPPLMQQTLCILLLIVALISIPSMLLIKPFFLLKEIEKQKHNDDKEYIELPDHDQEEAKEKLKNDNIFKNIALENDVKMKTLKNEEGANISHILNADQSHEDHGIGEIFIHQLIETIEFALGTVSNTASYLRLWALSLAHGQLADVFYKKLLADLSLSGGGSPVLLFLLFPAFASFSFFVLMCMDSMECFLHTLRLHWVEFQSKFYKGNGYKFVPLSFNQQIINEINCMNPIIKIGEAIELDLSLSDHSLELQPTIKEIKKKEEEEKHGEKHDEKHDEIKKLQENSIDKTKNKKDLVIQLKKYSVEIDLKSLNDAKERLDILRQSIKSKHDMLISANIEQQDPENVFQSHVTFDSEFTNLEETGAKYDSSIRKTEKVVKDINEFLSDDQNITNTSIEELENKIAKVSKINAKIKTFSKNVENLSVDHGVNIIKLDAFFFDTKPLQIQRCDFAQNESKQEEVKKRLIVWKEKLAKLTKDSNEQSQDATNSDKKKTFEDLKAKVQGWQSRYDKISSKDNPIFINLDNIKSRISSHDQKPLDMRKIRKTISLKEKNLNDFELEIQTVNILIDEMKLAELELVKFEDKQALIKALTADFVTKADELSQKLKKLDGLTQLLDTDLVPLQQTLEKTLCNHDYDNEQEEMSQRLTKVESKISLLDTIKSQISSDRSKITKLVSLARSKLSLSDLQSSLSTANTFLQTLNTNIAALKELVTYSKSVRASLSDLYILRNLDQKVEIFDTFRTNIFKMTEKLQLLQERIDQEKVDPKLIEKQRQIVQEAEEKVGQIYEKLQDLDQRRDEEDSKIGSIRQIIEDQPPHSASYDTLMQLIELILELQVGGEYTVEPLQEIDQMIDTIIDLMNEIDQNQEVDAKKKKIKDLKSNADKLLKDLKFIKSVIDSTDGYTTTEEEDKTYDTVGRDLNALILDLNGIGDTIKTYNDSGKFDDVDTFKKKTQAKIKKIEQSSEKHKDVFETIDWDAKLERRKNELYEAEQEIDTIIEDGKILLSDVKKIHSAASKNSGSNKDLITKFSTYIAKLEENLASFENQKAELVNINDLIAKFEDSMIVRDTNDIKKSAQMLKKNKEIKEGIHKCLEHVDSLDAEIDVIAEDRTANLNLTKKKYKAKKGDEVDELLSNLINNLAIDIDIKRTGDGKYMIGDKTISVKITNGKLFVRVGGGYVSMEEYMKQFGNNKLSRSERKQKREGRRQVGKKARALGYTGTTKVVGSADLMKSLQR